MAKKILSRLVRAAGDVPDRLRPVFYARINLAMSIDARKKSRGRPSVDTEELRARVDRSTIKGLDAWIAQQPEPRPSRPEAIRLALREWLTGLGLLPHAKDREDRH